MKFFKNENKLIFAVISFVISTSFGIITAEANNGNDLDYSKKSKVYFGYGNIDFNAGSVKKFINQDINISELKYKKAGAEITLDNNNKLKLEGASGNFTVSSWSLWNGSRNTNVDTKYLYVGVEHEEDNIGGKIALRANNLNVGNKDFTTVEFIGGGKYKFSSGVYLRGQASLGGLSTSKNNEISEATLFVNPEIAIGANIEIPNTLISITPELYSNIITSGASIQVDLNNVFVKLECAESNDIKDKKDTQILPTFNNSSFTVGLKF